MKIIMTLMIVIGLGCNSRLKDSRIDKDAIPLIDSFFKSLEIREEESGLDKLLRSNPNIHQNDSATINLKNSFILLSGASGPYVGYRLLKSRYIKEDIGIYSYLVKYEKKFYRFVFMFYNNGHNVKLYKFLFDDDLDVELEGSLKFYSN